MIAKITKGSDLKPLILKQEEKVEAKQSRVFATGYLAASKDWKELNFEEKVKKLGRYLANKNPRQLITTFQVSLNFHPSEQIKEYALWTIVHTYLREIGYGKQPFVAYEHLDKGRICIEVITTMVNFEGKKIDDRFDRIKSERVRKAIEKEHGLIQAEGRGKEKVVDNEKDSEATKGQIVGKAKAGKGETKKQIENILEAVLRDQTITSFEQFATKLLLYQVQVKGSKRKPKEEEQLMYAVTDEKGKRISLGLKASLFSCNPTLSNLTKIFESNKQATNKQE